LLLGRVEQEALMHTRLIALALLIGAGCSAPPPGSTRVVTGQLRVSTAGMSGPVVVAESSAHRVFVAKVTAKGRFALTLPPDSDYRLTLASSSSHAGHYSAVARINWPLADGAARWAHLGGGDTLDLGNVYKRGTRPSGSLGVQCDGCGDASSGDDGDDKASCKEDDGASTAAHDSDYDCDCDHAATDDDHCDHDDDADDHEHECSADDDDQGGDHDPGDHDDDDGHEHDGHACDGGTTMPTPPAPGAPDMSPVP
jgi:hypothetical protein